MIRGLTTNNWMSVVKVLKYLSDEWCTGVSGVFDGICEMSRHDGVCGVLPSAGDI